MLVLITATPPPGATVLPQGHSTDGLANSCAQQACTQQQQPEILPYAFAHDPVAIATLLLVFVTGALWIATYKLWRTTLGMADDAKDSAAMQAEKMERSIAEAAKVATAATDQVKIAQDTAYKQLRAYLSVEVQIETVTEELIGGRLRIKNAGQTPARFQMFYNRAIGPFPIIAFPENFPNAFAHGQHNPFVNAHSEETVQWFYGSGVENPAAQIAQLVANPKAVAFYIYGRIEFSDLEKTGRKLYFAFRNNGTVKLGTSFAMIAMPFGNAYVEGD